MLAEFAGIVHLRFHIKFVDRSELAAIGHFGICVELIVRGVQIRIVSVVQFVSGKFLCVVVAVQVFVVERKHTFHTQSFGQPVHVIVNDEVGFVDGVYRTVVTAFGKCCNDIVLVLRTTSVKAAGAFTAFHFISYGEYPSRCMVQFVECFAVVTAFIGIGSSAFFKASTEVYGERKIFGQEEVGIGTESIAAVAGA